MIYISIDVIVMSVFKGLRFASRVVHAVVIGWDHEKNVDIWHNLYQKGSIKRLESQII
jgi:hypothetical protein